MTDDDIRKEAEKLEAKVAQRKEREAQREREQMAKEEAERNAGPPEPVTQDDIQNAGAIAQAFGFAPMTKEQLLSTQQQTEEFQKSERDRRRREEAEARWNAICPAEFREPWDWAKCQADRAEVEKVLNWKMGKGGLFLLGQTGQCKSRAVYALIKRLVKEGIDPTIMSGTQFAAIAASKWANTDETERWLNAMARKPLVFIDDLGKRWTKSTEEAFFEVLDRRCARHAPIIITSNYDADDFARISAARGDGAIAQDLVAPIFRRIGDYLTPALF